MKRTLKILLASAALLLLVFFVLTYMRYGNKNEESAAPGEWEETLSPELTDSAIEPTEKPEPVEETTAEPDTVIIVPDSSGAPGELFPGEILVYSNHEMTEHEDELIVAVVGIKLNKDDVVSHISGTLGHGEAEVAADTQVHGATLSDSLRITLDFNPDDFKLIEGPKSYYLHFDKAHQPFFTWEVEPQSPGLKKLTVKLENYVNHSWTRYALPQVIEIDVRVNTKTFFVRIWDKLQNDPSWSLDHLLLPVLAFVGGLLASAIKKKLTGQKK